jgi:hypothetical protein
MKNKLIGLVMLWGVAVNALGYYMPGHGRWLSRDPLREGRIKKVDAYLFVRNQPITSFDKFGLLTITYCPGPLDNPPLPCGGIHHTWCIIPDAPLTEPSWVVSKITEWSDVTKCAGGRTRGEHVWWEAFPVAPGLGITDESVEPYHPKSYGNYRVDFVTTIVPDVEPYYSDIPSWGHTVPASDPGFSTNNEPLWWAEDVPEILSATHSSWSQWACCCPDWRNLDGGHEPQ